MSWHAMAGAALLTTTRLDLLQHKQFPPRQQLLLQLQPTEALALVLLLGPEQASRFGHIENDKDGKITTNPVLGAFFGSPAGARAVALELPAMLPWSNGSPFMQGS